MTLLQFNFEATLDFLRKISLDQVAGLSVSSLQQAHGASSTQHVGSSPEVVAVLFQTIESIKVPPHLVHLVGTLLPPPKSALPEGQLTRRSHSNETAHSTRQTTAIIQRL